MRKVFVTTSWDDGHILDKRLAKLLKKYGLRGTFYVSPKNRQFPQEELLTDSDIITLSQNFEIGAHTMTHQVLTKVGDDVAKKEILFCKKYLERFLGKEVVSFCYPQGKHNLNIQDWVKRAGFLYARTTQRHKFSRSENIYASATSIHTYKHYQDIFKIAQFSKWNPIELLKNMDWEHLAKRTFDSLGNGEIYHLWGHSWIIDNNNDWPRLERVLAYLGKRPEVSYLENKDLATCTS